MRKVKSPDDLTIDELRQLLVEKRRRVRMEHLERFRNTGRVITLAPEMDSAPNNHLHSESQSDQDISDFQAPRQTRTKLVFDRFLLVIEVMAVIGLFFIIYNGIQILRDLKFSICAIANSHNSHPHPINRSGDFTFGAYSTELSWWGSTE